MPLHRESLPISETTLARVPSFVAAKVVEFAARKANRTTWRFIPMTVPREDYHLWGRELGEAFCLYVKGSRFWVEYPENRFDPVAPQGKEADDADLWVIDESDTDPGELLVRRICFLAPSVCWS